MDISKMQTESKVYLGDMLPEIYILEGSDCPEDKRAYVVVRVANEADNRRRAEADGERTLSYLAPGSDTPVTERVRANRRLTASKEVWWTLVETGNITSGGEPVFPDGPTHKLNFSEFEVVWNNLPMAISVAIHAAVVSVNSAWDD